MLFRFQVKKGKKVVSGTITAPGIQAAREALVTKGLNIIALEPMPAGLEPSWAPTLRMISAGLLLLGTLAGLWSFLFAKTELKSTATHRKLGLKVSGRVSGDLAEASTISVYYPQIPLDLHQAISPGGNGEIDFMMEADYLSNQPLPHHFDVRLLDSSGKILWEKKSIACPEAGKEKKLGVLKVTQ